MLAYYPRRQQASPSSSLATLEQLYHGLPSPPPTLLLPSSSSSQVACGPSIALDTSHPSGIDCYNIYSLSSPHSFMPTTPSHNPPIRVHQSTPSPGEPQFSHSLPADDGNQPAASWLQYANYGHLTSQPGQQSYHKRHSSGSSIGSVGPASPYTPSTSYPHIHDSDLTSYPSPAYDTFDNHHSVSSSYPKPSLSAPVQTFSESFHLPQYKDYYSSPADNAQLHLAAMRQAIMAQQESEMGEASSAPRSVYAGGDYDDGFKIPSTNMPKLDRTISDIYQDELYNPIMASTPPITQPHTTASQGNLLSPHRDVFSERLQAANNSHIARSASPTTSISRERSPFRQGSEYAAEQYSHANTPVARIGSAARMREQQKAEADADAYQQHQPATTAPESPRTISPKEAMLDYVETEDSKVALFPRERSRVGGINQNAQFNSLKPVKQESTQSEAGEISTQQSFLSMATTRRESSSNYSSTSGLGQSRAKASNTSPGSIQVPQQYPFISQARRQNSSMGSTSEHPEFPASLTSMDSTKSEGVFKSSQEQSEPSAEIQRPSRTTADSGTYTCTYHGCTQRFETPAKLQKHKRDGHRQATPQNGAHSPNSGSGSSAAALLANRNSQAGPHKCERINPSTGKPCNSIFSRPYDLTRHEDTIHNARKQKVRCQFCTEEKTFSRNDALTRHMRVVHPEVDFPGKTKRKGVN